MRKVIVIVILAFFLVLLTTGVMAFDNEPDGFRGLKWGDPPGKHMRPFTTYAHFGVRIYERPFDKMKIGGAFLKSISYHFFEDRFMEVVIYPEGGDYSDAWKRENYDALKNVVFLKFGNEVIIKNDEFTEQTLWLGEKATVILRRHLENDSLALVIYSTEIQKEAERKEEEEKRKAVEEGLEDF